MWPALALGMGAGLLKSELIDRPQADKQRQLAATTATLSPWTGMTPTMPNEANPLGSMLQGGLAGMQVGQGMDKAAQEQALLEKLKQQQQPAPNTFVPKMGGNVQSPWASMGQMIS